VARIKIMQIDEDIGKVAQATPVLISNALDAACARNGKRLFVAHLEATILATDQFDFLKDVVNPAESATDVTVTQHKHG